MLEGMKTNTERVDYLSEICPALTIFVLQKRANERLRTYEERFKSYGNDKDTSKWSLYLYGYWLPFLQRLE